MPKKTLLIATVDGPQEVEATVMKLRVGEKAVRFFVHEKGTITRLSHYASGYSFGDLGPIKLAHAVRWGTGAQMSDRAAAEVLIKSAIDLNGADYVLSHMASKPVLNPT